MAQVLVRNLDDSIVAQLKLKAAKENMSLEQYLRGVFEREACGSKAEALARLKQIREETGAFDFDSTAAVRNDRDKR